MAQKNQVVQYPGLPDGQTLHTKDCRFVKPSRNKPFTSSRDAIGRELTTYPKCKVC